MLDTSTPLIIDPSIFRAYDIRGVVGSSLTEKSVYAIGQAIGTLVIKRGEKSIFVGKDGRLSGPSLSQALSAGILSSGCDVMHLGVIPTPLLYYATHMTKTTSGVMLTGSHNPPEYNGLKIVMTRVSLSEDGLKNLYQSIVDNNFHQGEGELNEMEMIERYINHVAHDVKLARPLKVVVDCGNGVPGCVAPQLYRQLGCEVHELFCDVDGHFPNHHPDPSQPDNLQDLIKKVKEVKADIGLAFDGDGDRLGVVTSTGTIIWPDRQLMLFAKAILKKQPGAKIIYDVKCTNHLATVIQSLGGEPLMWKTGHSLIKAKLAETQAALAGEMSGHIFIKDRWFGFDDALYAGARLLEILAADSADSHTLFNDLPNSINTPELKVFVADNEKFSLMEKLIAHANFHTAKDLLTLDGLRVNFSDGWGLVRPSNTTPCLVFRFEADNQTVLTKIQKLFRDWLLTVNPALELPF